MSWLDESKEEKKYSEQDIERIQATALAKMKQREAINLLEDNELSKKYLGREDLSTKDKEALRSFILLSQSVIEDPLGNKNIKLELPKVKE